MNLELREEPVSAAATLSELPTAFVVDRVLDVVPDEAGLDGVTLRERPLSDPYLKDYDAVDGNAPADWLGFEKGLPRPQG